MYDLLIKNGTVVDGSGAPGQVLDVAIVDGRIAALGIGLEGDAAEVVDATGLLVTPGFIDIHTHYDAQILWDGDLQPSASNGVTTCIVGNCGVGLAPVRPNDVDWLLYVLQVIEEVPAAVVRDAVDITFESFAEYLDEVAKRSYSMDIVTQVPHVALRAYVMGERGIRNEPATPDDIAAMAKIVREAVVAGAAGFSTSRSYIHNIDTGPLPGTLAGEDEILAIAEAIAEAGGGVVQMIPSGQTGVVQGDGRENRFVGMNADPHWISDEVKLMRRLHQRTGVGCTFSFGSDPSIGPDYERVVAEIDAAHAAGEPIVPQTAARFLNALVNLDGQHIFLPRPTYRSIAHLPRAERARRMADPAVKAAILSEEDGDLGTVDPLQLFYMTMRRSLKSVFPFEESGFDYEPTRDRSVQALAEAAGVTPEELFYDLLIAEEGEAVLIWFADYSDRVTRLKEQQFRNAGYGIGVGDAGAHSKLLVDAGIYTHVLANWAKDRANRKGVPVEALVNRSTKLVADLYGLADRGEIAVGKRADLNVIDHERLSYERPRMVADLPGGAMRYLQDGIGYVMTVVNGVPVRRNDADTGARPGRLARNQRSAALRATAD